MVGLDVLTQECIEKIMMMYCTVYLLAVNVN
jgi:hypothetical protein